VSREGTGSRRATRLEPARQPARARRRRRWRSGRCGRFAPQNQRRKCVRRTRRPCSPETQQQEDASGSRQAAHQGFSFRARTITPPGRHRGRPVLPGLQAALRSGDLSQLRLSGGRIRARLHGLRQLHRALQRRHKAMAGSAGMKITHTSQQAMAAHPAGASRIACQAATI